MERLRAGLNGSEWVGWSYVFYPVTPGTSGRCQGGKERPARPPPASSHESHVLDNAPAAAREPPPPAPAPAPRCLRLRRPFPEEGAAARPGSCPSGWGARKLEGAGEPPPPPPPPPGPGGGGGDGDGGAATWANLPQGNEVSSRLPGGDGGGRIRPRLTQAGRGISPRSLQPSPPPPRNRRAAEGVARPPALPGGWCRSPGGVPAPTPGPASRNRPPRGGAEGRGGCHPMGSGRAAQRRAAEAAAEHAART
ncbi:hypothetical protein VULLAG_LOCUS2664 [Vulpes lagopus]